MPVGVIGTIPTRDVGDDTKPIRLRPTKSFKVSWSADGMLSFVIQHGTETTRIHINGKHAPLLRQIIDDGITSSGIESSEPPPASSSGSG